MSLQPKSCKLELVWYTLILCMKVNEILKWVLQNPYSDFYKQKYSSLKSLDFTQLPFLTRDELTAHPAEKYLFVPLKQIGCWCVSSGTTASGSPLMIPKIFHPDPALDILVRLLEKHKVENYMVLVRITSFLADKFKSCTTSADLKNKRPVILGDIYDLNLAAKMAQNLGVDGLETTPSILHFFIPFLKEINYLDNIKFISLGGEYTSEHKLEFFKSYFKNAFFYFRFGGTENPIYKGFRCQYISSLPPRFFHPNTDFYLYEILDPEGVSVKVGERGELVLTTLKKSAFPLIRYKTGDAIIWHTTKICQCGSRDLIEVFGRMGYDFVRISGLTIHIENFEKVLAQIDPKLLPHYQLHVYEVVERKQLLPKLTLHLSAKISKTKQDKLKQKIESSFYLSPTMTLKELIDQGIILPLEIKSEQGKEVSYKTVKIVSHIK